MGFGSPKPQQLHAYRHKIMLKKLIIASLFFLPMATFASGSEQTVEQIFYCGNDFAMKMSGGEWYLVQESIVGEKKFNHFLSLGMFAMASGKKTGNIFPEDPISGWCGNNGFRPIKMFSIKN